MNAIQKLKQARNIEDLATQIEPLAQALAHLVDEADRARDEQQATSLKQAQEWSQCQKQSAQAWQESAQMMKAAAHGLTLAANQAEQAATHWTLHLWLGVIIAAILPMLVLLSVFWLYLEPHVTTQNGATWLVMKLSQAPAPISPTEPPKHKSTR